MTEGVSLHKATIEDASSIWEILQQAILKRKEEGSKQWQDGYPNLEVVENDIEKGFAYVIKNENNKVIAYVAIMDEVEEAYNHLDGEWLTNEDYVAIHRLAVTQDNKIKGLGTWIMQKVEEVALSKNINSIKVDTNFDNVSMLRVFEKLNYTYCGKVYFRGGEREAFEKILS